MDKIMVLSTDIIFNNKLKRIMNMQLFFNDSLVNLNVINRYLNQEKPQVLIIHHSVKCNNLSKLFDYLVTNKIIPVIYIHNTVNFSQFYQVLNDIFFLNLEETKIELTLPVVVPIYFKISEQIKKLNKDVNKLETKLTDKKIVHKAKMLLMERKKFSENEAHQYIIKQAMEKRLSKEKIALEILENDKN